MKESKLIELSNKVELLGKANNQIVQELSNLKDLCVGTMELMKELPDYEGALERLKESLTKEKEE